MSKREEMFHRLSDLASDLGLMTSPMAGIESRLETRGKPYSTTIGTARWMDGEMVVYGPTFIQFRIQGSPMNNGRRSTSHICKSEEKAEAFLRAMADGDRETALDQTAG